MSFTSPSRRALITATAWSVPAIAVASASPAFASSACTDVFYNAAWSNGTYSFAPAVAGAANLYQSGKGTFTAAPVTTGLTPAQQASLLALPPMVVTAQNVVPTTGTTNRMRGFDDVYDGRTIQNMRVTTFNASGFGGRALALAQQATGTLGTPYTNHYQELTLSFARPVKNLSFRIGDIDGTNNNHSDRVSLSGSRTGAKQSNVSGDGLSAATTAWRPTANGLQNDETSTAGNVAVVYDSTTLVSAVVLRFWNNDSTGGRQWIFLSNLTFTSSSC